MYRPTVNLHEIEGRWYWSIYVPGAGAKMGSARSEDGGMKALESAHRELVAEYFSPKV